VLDLACGPGSITRRLLARFPSARSVAVDIDPALLAIARATFAGDERVTVVQADLVDPGWAAALPLPASDGAFDAVVTATALHWLPEPVLRRLYRDLHGLVRPGGAIVNVDEMPPAELPRLAPALKVVERARRAEQMADGRPDWDEWWQIADADPLLTAAVAERRARFGGDHADSFVPPSAWHIQALHDAGFAESGIVWQAHSQAAVAALR
jgi:SAM-dependent methyltransferase